MTPRLDTAQTGPSTLAPEVPVLEAPRSYEVRTFGCQMNVHDSERISGMLETAGYVPAQPEDEPDLIVFNTCAVRENADNKLYGNLSQLVGPKKRNERMQVAVGGCLAQKDQDRILETSPVVDVVFGTHNIGSLPTLLERARHNEDAQIEILESLETFPSALPTKRDQAYAGWVSISVGCNNTCTFCIVPSLRGKEKDRRPGEILAEVQALVDAGVANGLPRSVATKLAAQTMLGSAAMLLDRIDAGTKAGDGAIDASATVLRAMVTSPGGTTAAGLRELEAGGLRAAVANAVSAAKTRSEQLGITSE